MGNQFTNIFSNYKLERVIFFGVGVLDLPFCLVKRVRNLFLFFLLLDQKEAKLKAERSFCALGLYAGPPFCRAGAFYFLFLVKCDCAVVRCNCALVKCYCALVDCDWASHGLRFTKQFIGEFANGVGSYGRCELRWRRYSKSHLVFA